jgi:hypothetical protein
MKTQIAALVACALSLSLAACGAPAPSTPTPSPAAARQADLSAIKTYLLAKTRELKTGTAGVKAASDAYYDLAKAANSDYATLWPGKAPEIRRALADARAAWLRASPLYEQVEGIVAGTPSLAEFDVILDAGASGDEDPDNAVPFDLTLPDGRVLPKPGNLFGVTESALWGTFSDYKTTVSADWDGSGTLEPGEALPDASVLKGGADALDRYAGELLAAAAAWEPTDSDAFTALVVMVPTMSEYFNSWKASRLILGEASTQRDFVAISRLADIQDILGSRKSSTAASSRWLCRRTLGKPPKLSRVCQPQAFVADVHAKEQQGRKYPGRRRPARRRGPEPGDRPRRTDRPGRREARRLDRRVILKRLRLLIALIAACLLPFAGAETGRASSPPPSQSAEAIRAGLLQAQLDLATQPDASAAAVREAATAYRATLADVLGASAPEAHARVLDGLDTLGAGPPGQRRRLRRRPRPGVDGDSRRQLHNDGSRPATEGCSRRAEWLPVREFRTATRFARPNADATLAVEARSGKPRPGRCHTRPAGSTSSTPTRPAWPRRFAP